MSRHCDIELPLLQAPAHVSGVDIMLMESTYGGRLHRDRAATLEELGGILRDASRDGGNVLADVAR